MIILEGTITNKIIPGANGDFSVGNFNTEIGQFKIKSQLLDQFEEGDYQVRVSVVKLSLNTYVVRRSGITITEIIADIDSIDVIDADIKTIDNETIEPDASIDETSDHKPDVKTGLEDTGTDRSPTVDKQPTAEASKQDQDDLVKLFGILWPLGKIVQLDSTTPRTQFIRQKDYLKANGYKFHSPDQTWHKQ
jgi:hypothetical protein